MVPQLLVANLIAAGPQYIRQFCVTPGTLDEFADDRPDCGSHRVGRLLEGLREQMAFAVGDQRGEHQGLLPVLGCLFREALALRARVELVPDETARLRQSYRDAMATGKHGAGFGIGQQVVVIRHGLRAPVKLG